MYDFVIDVESFPVQGFTSTGRKVRMAFEQGLGPIFVRSFAWSGVWLALTSETEGDRAYVSCNAKFWHKGLLIRCVNKHWLTTFIALHFSIALAVDARDKRRIKANSISIHVKRKPS